MHLSSLETTPESSFDDIGSMYAPRESDEPDERALPPPDHHHHRQHGEKDHHHRPHAHETGPDQHHHRAHARLTDHHHRPFEHGPRASLREMTPEEETAILHPEDKTGHHHRPFDKGAAWAPHMDPRGFVPHQKVKAALIRRGFSPEDASAITGNLIYESGGNQYSGHPVILNPPRGAQSGDAARGAAQWEKGGGRWEGLSSPSLDAQVEHIWNEMHGSEARSYAAMRGAKTVAEKAHIVNAMYERPRRPRNMAGSSSDRGRIRAAEEAYRGRDDEVATSRGATPRTGGGLATPGPWGALMPARGREGQIAGVDKRLMSSLAAGASHLPQGYRVEPFSGNSPTHGSAGSKHRLGQAVDVNIIDPSGRAIPNEGPDTTGMYRRLAQFTYGEMLRRYPELATRFAHGAQFGTSKGSGIPDLMHYDIGGQRRSAGPQFSPTIQELGPPSAEKHSMLANKTRVASSESGSGELIKGMKGEREYFTNPLHTVPPGSPEMPKSLAPSPERKFPKGPGNFGVG
jgi:Phage tail lysozyme